MGYFRVQEIAKRIFPIFVLLAIVLSVGFVAAQDDQAAALEHIDVLTNSTIDDYLKTHQAVLLLFYVPWCHWSRRLIPRFQTAAALLASQNVPVKFAQVNTQIHETVVNDYNIMSYPTMRLYLDGTPRDYDAGRSQQEIVNWVVSHLNTEIVLHTAEQLKIFLATHASEPALIGKFSMTTKSRFRDTFISVSRRVVHAGFAELASDDAYNALKKISKLPDAINNKSEYILLINPHHNTNDGNDDEPPTVLYEGSITDVTAIHNLIKKFIFPRLVEFEYEIDSRVFQDGRPVWVLFTRDDQNPLSKNAIAETKKLAMEFRERVVFLHSNENAIFDKKLRTQLVVEDHEAVTIRVFKANPSSRSLKYKPDAGILSKLDFLSLKKFLEGVLTNKVSPFYRTEEKPDPLLDTGPVYTLVAQEFQKSILDAPYDSVVEFYAPWCGHCRQLESTYRKVAELLKPNTELRVFKMDATLNEVNLRIFGYPTVVLFKKKNSKAEPEYYMFEGDRTVENILYWISVTASRPFDAQQLLKSHRTDASTPKPWLFQDLFAEEL